MRTAYRIFGALILTLIVAILLADGPEILSAIGL